MDHARTVPGRAQSRVASRPCPRGDRCGACLKTRRSRWATFATRDCMAWRVHASCLSLPYACISILQSLPDTDAVNGCP